MNDAAPRAVLLSDYAPYPFRVEAVSLTFRLAPSATRVLSAIRFAPNPDAAPARRMRLDGEGLRLIRASIDGAALLHNMIRCATMRSNVPSYAMTGRWSSLH